MEITVVKRDKSKEDFNPEKLKRCLKSSFKEAHIRYRNDVYEGILKMIEDLAVQRITVETMQDLIERYLMSNGYEDVAKHYILYRKEHERIRDWVQTKKDFIDNYKRASNTANATIDDNSNMSSKNIGIMNNEIHKPDNIQISRRMIQDKLRDLFPDFDSKQYVRDLNNHILYKHDESSFAGATAPYCVSGTMYPFLLNGIKDIGGLSAAPKNLDSFCGMYINYIFAMSGQFAGAVATSEFLLYFDYFARKEWGDDYYTVPDEVISGPRCRRTMTIRKQIRQYFQQVVYSINQPAAARGLQSAFVNFSYFDKPFFEGMFGDFYFPDNTPPKWESLWWLQREFMMWFNEERTKCMITFPVESYALVYRDGKYVDEQSADFVAEEYARGHSFFTYISDTVDSLSSCCFDGDEVIKVYGKDGMPSMIPISDFVKIYTNIENSKGENVETDFHIDSFDDNGNECGKTKINGVLMKKYTGQMITITTEDGEIEVTEDHPVLVKDNTDDTIKTIPAIQLVNNAERYDVCVE